MWWDETIARWHGEGLPPELTDIFEIHDYFGLDPYKQFWFSTTDPTIEAAQHHVEGVVSNMDDYLAHRPNLFPDHGDAIRGMKPWFEHQDGGDAVIWITLEGYFWFPRTLMGFTKLMLAFYDNPDNLKYYIARVMKQREPILHGFVRCGYDGIYAEEIFSGVDIISPELFDEFVFPFNKEYFRITRTLGLLTAYYVCGNPMPLISRILQFECDAVAFEESKKNFSIEIEDVVKQAGKEKCVFGNIDAPYYGLQANADEIRTEVERQIRAGRGARGFVVSIGSPYPLDSRLKNIDMIVAAAHSHKPG